MDDDEFTRDFGVDRTTPSANPGGPGRIKRSLGPDKTPAETQVEVVGGLFVVAAIVALARDDALVRGWSVGQLAVAALVTLDLVCGVLVNATSSAKRWYHRPGPGRARARLAFVSRHVLHLIAVAVILLPADFRWLWTHVLLLVVTTAVIELASVEVKRPVAAAATIWAVALGQALAPLEGILILLPPLLYFKLLTGHLVPEDATAAYATGPPDAGESGAEHD